MVIRQKKSCHRVYLQIVENRWEQGRSKQRVIATLGRLDRLSESGQLDALLQSGATFSESVMVPAAHREGEAPGVCTRRIGPALGFARLWGGRQRRGASARAIVADPLVLLADEPTGNLDREAAAATLHLLSRLNREFGKTLLMVTHDPLAAEAAGRVVHLDKGRIESDA